MNNKIYHHKINSFITKTINAFKRNTKQIGEFEH